MIRMIQSKSAAQAKKYFNNALQQSDYYLDDQELAGSFHGRLVERLGLHKNATKEVFHDLCENVHPHTGKNLTARTNQFRTVGYDINFHCPKSVSVLHVLSKDQHILDAFQQSVQETMHDIESDAMVRKRKNGKNENQLTGELLWGEFIHQTARPVKSMSPDPHLHAHCFTFNVTWDKEEDIFKAAQFRNIKRDMPYYQAMFHKRLADNLVRLGYRIRRTKKAFEIAGVPQAVINEFSKRTNEIGQFAKEHHITDEAELDKLGGRTRSKKQSGLSMSDLKTDWRKQIHSLGLKNNKAEGKIIRYQMGKDILPVSALQCIDHALQHRFERQSVIQDRRLLETAFRYGMATSALTIHAIKQALASHSQIIQATEEDTIFCTTHNIVKEEERMVNLAAEGKRKYEPFYDKLPRIDLDGEHAKAVETILTNTDQVIILAGRAGTGKTTLMKETVKSIEATGQKVTIVAPTAQAARNVLKSEGFEQAETVSKLLADQKLQQDLSSGVLWVDEAGQLGVQDMTALLDLAVAKNARVILGGDIRQHSSVARGDALRVLQCVAGLTVAETTTIHRQKNKAYREAVQAISEGNVKSGFNQLDNMGSVIEIDPSKPSKQLVNDYLMAIESKKSVLVVSPTHQQGKAITGEIRKVLKKTGRIGKLDRSVTQLVNLNFTNAEKEDIRNYTVGQVIQFNQNSTGIQRGSVWSINDIHENALTLIDQQNEKTIFVFERKKDFDVFEQNKIALSKNDRIRITRNGLDNNKKRLNNGQELKVLGFDKKNNIRLLHTRSKTKYKVAAGFGHMAHAYCITSHASQGKTVDEVLIYQPAATFPATDLKQFYVSVSRGREACSVYTDDKEELLSHVMQIRNRTSAMELLQANKKMTSEHKEMHSEAIPHISLASGHVPQKNSMYRV